ncbi:5-dehydro-4-deoxy-D-glucuronate isomerase [bacterium]|nr:5-dehydro-4-deoxy-D-glucuronate isomerase [bacterium]
MELRYLPDPVRYKGMNTGDLRAAFLLDGLFRPDSVVLSYFEVDRTIAGSAVPVKKSLRLEAPKEMTGAFFAERREIGILNIGGPGAVNVDGISNKLGKKEALYIGRGSREIEFASDKSAEPARFYILSYPAHKEYPVRKVSRADAESQKLGSPESANQRTIHKLILPGKVQTCQLVMGFTELAAGSVWNTMPPHTHDRRNEVYLYFDMDENTRVFHLFGLPQETRHLVVSNGQAVVSPSWSIHSGVGTGAYTFCWGMGGENQEFSDMDAVGMGDIR